MTISLLDIAPYVERVTIGSQTIECRGIGSRSLVRLLQRFPTLRDVLSKAVSQGSQDLDFDLPSLLAETPDAIAAILAAGTGHPEDPEHEEAAAELPMEVQADLLTGVLKATMPEGVGPFVEKVMAAFASIRGSAAPSLPVTGFGEESQSRPNGKVSDTPSPSLSSG